MYGRLSFEQYVTEIKKFQTFLLHLLVSCMSICLLVEYGAILSVIFDISVNNGGLIFILSLILVLRINRLIFSLGDL